ncbi:MAG: hypothetical protein AB7S75_23020 [Desulfococcaceae bacterium]
MTTFEKLSNLIVSNQWGIGITLLQQKGAKTIFGNPMKKQTDFGQIRKNAGHQFVFVL